MRTNYLILLLTVITLRLGYAQTESKYTLDQCIEFAMKNSNSAKNKELDEYIAKAQRNEYTGIGLPQINGSASVIDNPQLMRMFLNFDASNPGFAGSFFQGYPGPVPSGVYGFPNQFQLRSNGDAKVSLTQIIFNGSYLVGLKASKTLIELSKKSTILNNTQIVENVTKAFYTVLITRERKVTLDANISNLDNTLKNLRALNEQGFIEKIDVDRLEVTYNNLLSEKAKLDLYSDLMLNLLKFQMGYDVNLPIEIEGDLKTITDTTIQDNIDSSAYLTRPEYSLLKVQLKLEGHNLTNKRMYYLPSLVGFGNLGANRGSTSLGGLFQKRGQEVLFPIDGEYKDISGTWFGYYNYGLSLNVPIFSGFTQHAKVQQSKLAIQKIENDIESFKQITAIQSSQAVIGIKSNLLSLENQKRNLTLATEVKRVAQIKYEQGIGSSLEVVNAETSFKEAQTNYYNALFDLLVSTIDYKKATGTLTQAK